MATAELRISNVPVSATSRKTLAFSIVQGSDIVIRSPLPDSASINDHLVWFLGGLKHERRFLKSLQSEGAKVHILASTEGPMEIKPNGAETLHLLEATLEVTSK